MILNLISSIKYTCIRLFAPATMGINKYDIMHLSRKGQESARLATKEHDAEIVGIVEELSNKLHQKPPKIILYKEDQPNAAWFSNRGNGTILITTGHIKGFSADELRTTIAHELTHKQQKYATSLRHIIFAIPPVIAGIVATIAVYKEAKKPKLTALTALIGGLIYEAASRIGNFITQPIKMWYTRQLEFDADRGGLLLTNDLESFKSKFKKQDEFANQRKAEALEPIPPTSSHISDEIKPVTPPKEKYEPTGLRKFLNDINRTHATHEQRISHLEKVKKQMDSGELKNAPISRFF